jgi:hypothetical protein
VEIGEGMATEIHGFPIETPRVGDAATVGQFGEINGVGECFETGKVFFKRWSIERESRKEQATGC